MGRLLLEFPSQFLLEKNPVRYVFLAISLLHTREKLRGGKGDWYSPYYDPSRSKINILCGPQQALLIYGHTTHHDGGRLESLARRTTLLSRFVLVF